MLILAFSLSQFRPNDLEPIAHTSCSFSEMHQKWSVTEKEAVYQSVLKFDLYLKGAQCILHCDHK